MSSERKYSPASYLSPIDAHALLQGGDDVGGRRARVPGGADGGEDVVLAHLDERAGQGLGQLILLACGGACERRGRWMESCEGAGGGSGGRRPRPSRGRRRAARHAPEAWFGMVQAVGGKGRAPWRAALAYRHLSRHYVKDRVTVRHVSRSAGHARDARCTLWSTPRTKEKSPWSSRASSAGGGASAPTRRSRSPRSSCARSSTRRAGRRRHATRRRGASGWSPETLSSASRRAFKAALDREEADASDLAGTATSDWPQACSLRAVELMKTRADDAGSGRRSVRPGRLSGAHGRLLRRARPARVRFRGLPRPGVRELRHRVARAERVPRRPRQGARHLPVHHAGPLPGPAARTAARLGRAAHGRRRDARLSRPRGARPTPSSARAPPSTRS